MNKITNPLSPAQGLLIGLWDTAYAVRVLERDHGKACTCPVCIEAGRIGYLLMVMTQLLEDALGEGNENKDLTAVTYHWEGTRGRPIDHASIDAEPNPAGVLPRWPKGEKNVPPVGTAAQWDRQFVSAPHRLMKALTKAQQAHGLLKNASDSDEDFAWHAEHIMGLLEPMVNTLECGSLGDLGEDWVVHDFWADADPEIGYVPKEEGDEFDEPHRVDALDLIGELAETALPPAGVQPPGGFLWAVVSLRGRKARDWFATEAKAAAALPSYQEEEPTETFFVQCWPALAAARHVDEPWEHFAETA